MCLIKTFFLNIELLMYFLSKFKYVNVETKLTRINPELQWYKNKVATKSAKNLEKALTNK